MYIPQYAFPLHIHESQLTTFTRTHPNTSTHIFYNTAYAHLTSTPRSTYAQHNTSHTQTHSHIATHRHTHAYTTPRLSHSSHVMTMHGVHMPQNLGPTYIHAQLDMPCAHLPHPHIPTLQTQLSSHHGTKKRKHVL